MIRCIGIDLAWSPRNNSGGFALEIDHGVASEVDFREGLKSNVDILAFIDAAAGNGPALVAIDAPLVVPNASGARDCDKEITRHFGRYHAGAHPANRQLLGRYGGLAESLVAEMVPRLGFTLDPHISRQTSARHVVEVFPHPGIVALFGLDRILKYKRGRMAQRRAELIRLENCLLSLANATPALRVDGGWRHDITKLRGQRFKRYEDLLDSLFCAYVVAYCWHHGPTHYEVFGNVRDGHILIPIPPDQRPRFGLAPALPRSRL